MSALLRVFIFESTQSPRIDLLIRKSQINDLALARLILFECRRWITPRRYNVIIIYRRRISFLVALSKSHGFFRNSLSSCSQRARLNLLNDLLLTSFSLAFVNQLKAETLLPKTAIPDSYCWSVQFMALVWTRKLKQRVRQSRLLGYGWAQLVDWNSRFLAWVYCNSISFVMIEIWACQNLTEICILYSYYLMLSSITFLVCCTDFCCAIGKGNLRAHNIVRNFLDFGATHAKLDWL